MKTLLPNLNATPVSPSVLSGRTSFQADPLPSDNAQSFSSTLAREVADRSTSDQQVKSSRNQQSQPVQNTNAAHNTADAQSADSNQTQNAQDAQSAQQAADGKQVDTKKDDKAKADKDAAAASDADKTSTDLLALVAASQQIEAKAAPRPDATVPGQPVAAMLTADIVNSEKNSHKTDAVSPDTRATKTVDLTQTLPDTLDKKAGKSGKADPSASFKDIADANNASAGSTPAKGDAAAAQSSTGASTPALNANALAKAAPDTQVPTGPTAVNNNAMFNPALQVVNNTPAAAAVAADKLAPTVGTTDWDTALGQKMVWMSGNGQQSATLTLNPKDLGPLQVVINVNKTQADATFIASSPEVKAALEAAMPKLREMMDQAGIQLGQANVSTGMPNQQQQAFNQPQRSNNNGSGNGQGRNNGNSSGNDDGVIATGATAPASAGKSGLGLVDTFV
jgi:flagellar hook-length control protein FliK